MSERVSGLPGALADAFSGFGQDGVEFRPVQRSGIEQPLEPKAFAVLERHARGASPLSTLRFMSGGEFEIAGSPVWISRSGYTGEDGFEISVLASDVSALADALCAQEAVKPIGLGARDSLRLEAGLPLYGHDLDEGIDPVEGGHYDLVWQYSTDQPPTAGVITSLVEPKLLVIDTDNRGRIAFSLEAFAGGGRGIATRLRLSVALELDRAFVARVRANWLISLDQLEEVLRGHPVDWENWDRDHIATWTGYRDGFAHRG